MVLVSNADSLGTPGEMAVQLVKNGAQASAFLSQYTSSTLCPQACSSGTNEAPEDTHPGVNFPSDTSAPLPTPVCPSGQVGQSPKTDWQVEVRPSTLPPP